jgi:hypothetical protein
MGIGLLPEWDEIDYKSNPLPRRELLAVACQGSQPKSGLAAMIEVFDVSEFVGHVSI